MVVDDTLQPLTDVEDILGFRQSNSEGASVYPSYTSPHHTPHSPYSHTVATPLDETMSTEVEAPSVPPHPTSYEQVIKTEKTQSVTQPFLDLHLPPSTPNVEAPRPTFNDFHDNSLSSIVLQIEQFVTNLTQTLEKMRSVQSQIMNAPLEVLSSLRAQETGDATQKEDILSVALTTLNTLIEQQQQMHNDTSKAIHSLYVLYPSF